MEHYVICWRKNDQFSSCTSILVVNLVTRTLWDAWESVCRLCPGLSCWNWWPQETSNPSWGRPDRARWDLHLDLCKTVLPLMLLLALASVPLWLGAPFQPNYGGSSQHSSGHRKGLPIPGREPVYTQVIHQMDSFCIHTHTGLERMHTFSNISPQKAMNES